MRKQLSDQQYEEVLKSVPPHDSDEFIEYLVANNRVIYIDPNWLVIENIKYHRKDRPWYTAFSLRKKLPSFSVLQRLYGHMEWLKKHPSQQSIKRFHIHFYNP